MYFSNACSWPTKAIFGQDFSFWALFKTDLVSGQYTKLFLRKLFFSRIFASWRCNFRIRLPGFSAARKDSGLKIWRWSSLKISLCGILLHEQNPIDERYQKSMIQDDFVTRDFGSWLFAFWLDRGERFAPFEAIFSSSSPFHKTQVIQATISPLREYWKEKFRQICSPESSLAAEKSQS